MRADAPPEAASHDQIPHCRPAFTFPRPPVGIGMPIPGSSHERKPSMITVTAILNAIEAHANRAIVQELRLIKKEVEKLRSSLRPDDQEHADALLLKLDRLIFDQIVVANDVVVEQVFQPVAQTA
jgi:hypothetical protein